MRWYANTRQNNYNILVLDPEYLSSFSKQGSVEENSMGMKFVIILHTRENLSEDGELNAIGVRFTCYLCQVSRSCYEWESEFENKTSSCYWNHQRFKSAPLQLWEY